MIEWQDRPPTTMLGVLQGRATMVLAAMLGFAITGLLVGPPGHDFAAVGIAAIPMSFLAVLAHVGERAGWARICALALLALIALFAAASFVAPMDELLRLRLSDVDEATLDATLDATSQDMWWMALIGACLAALLWVPVVRRQVARALPIDSERFTHTIALSLTVTLIFSACAPLVVLGEPLFTALALESQKAKDAAENPASLYEQVYQLLWLLPMCLLAVGYGVHRNLSESLQRLGIVRPTPRQALAAVGVAVALALVAMVLNVVIGGLWTALGWDTTNSEGIQELMGYMLTPAGAVVVGVCAGLGEELLVRGVLQPRLGIVLSNALFTAMHAGQYGWELLLVIFTVGAIFGLVRQRTNTTVSAMVHGFYDVLLISLAMA